MPNSCTLTGTHDGSLNARLSIETGFEQSCLSELEEHFCGGGLQWTIMNYVISLGTAINRPDGLDYLLEPILDN